MRINFIKILSLNLGRSDTPVEFTTCSLKEINPEYSLQGLMLKLKFQYSSHLMQRADSLEKTLILGKIKSKRRRKLQDEMVR